MASFRKTEFASVHPGRLGSFRNTGFASVRRMIGFV